MLRGELFEGVEGESQLREIVVDDGQQQQQQQQRRLRPDAVVSARDWVSDAVLVSDALVSSTDDQQQPSTTTSSSDMVDGETRSSVRQTTTLINHSGSTVLDVRESVEDTQRETRDVEPPTNDYDYVLHKLHHTPTDHVSSILLLVELYPRQQSAS